MSKENVERLKEGYEAFNRGDIETAFQNFDQGIAWHATGSQIPASGEYLGLDAVRADWLKDVAAGYDEFSVQPEQFLDGGDHVVVLGKGHTKLKNGATADGLVAHIWKYNGDKIVEAWFFGDSAQILKAMEA
jgi:uncharacterized protein